MRIAMIGTGYVGLVSAACLSEFGHDVVCVDKDGGKIADLDAGRVPIFEPGLEEIVAANVRARRLSFTAKLARAVARRRGRVHRRGNAQSPRRRPCRSELRVRRRRGNRGRARQLCGGGHQIDGAGRHRAARWRRSSAADRPQAEFDVASNPEFLREGSAIEDFLRPDRVVVGCDTDRARDVLKEVYRPLYLNETPILFTARESAELIKYAANAFLATKITFINEMADLCERWAATCRTWRAASGSTAASAAKFLHAGPGYGGSCFPKDTLALLQHVAGSRRAHAHRGDCGCRQRGAQDRNGAQDPARVRRREGQDRGRAGPDVQAEHR